ncbi:hypothetical protein NIES2135_64980 (plasmid) [Leptolyngbya boryana NIES-2135]|uniref:Type IV secretion system coupling protein TraD DNA-binding domain-containing protein n=1 Tax=Leptolyngbya boryana NIES-2135 TaxID=1973484 RepID=A0A1Z4JS75_LEPBY|nr:MULTISPECIES: type IV secretion system DNA-binding domain-containing protein [Leptolyngbya]BAY59621.1 hypothetical protein NIES2135_64980 [Leptolyngbya boryana NIES-2135]MBD2371362.1 type IV secretion system DNA-binding domain-containing protein [Leptolyngbya sp. FACHB-161]MBD2377822.1 type IV secretion system DNA-binding domain-containing protein [Leptolyngbya sp. FACHB-238]MBD2402259.1 type IV secretion system DNA-binding domain-containing protein [Leptolyngbya sp. FACHB-239]MBD2408752.1 
MNFLRSASNAIAILAILISSFVVSYLIVLFLSGNYALAQLVGFMAALVLTWWGLAAIDALKRKTRLALKPLLSVILIAMLASIIIVVAVQFFAASLLFVAVVAGWVALAMIAKSFETHATTANRRAESPNSSVTGIVQTAIRSSPIPNLLEFGWGNVLVPFLEQPHHFLFLGTTGSGKSVRIRHLLRSVIGGIGVLPKWGALILDAKRDMVPWLEGQQIKYYILNPLDSRFVAWDIARDIVGPFRAKQFAVGIIFDEIPTKHNQNQFFYDVAVILLANILEALHDAFGIYWTLLDLVRICASSQTMENFLRTHHRNFEKVADYFKAGKKDKNDAVLTVKSRVDLLDPIAAIWQHCPKISLTEILNGNAVGLLGVDEEASETVEVANTLISRFLMGCLQSLPDDKTRRFWLVLDELPKAGSIHRGLEAAMAIGRSKGVVVILGLQDVAQGIETFGENVFKSIFGLARYHAYCGLDDSSAQWVSTQYGQFEVELRSNSTSLGADGSISQSINYSTGQRPCLPPQMLSDVNYLTAQGLWAVFRVPKQGLHRHFDSWEFLNRFEVIPTSTPGYLRFAHDDPRLRVPKMTDAERIRLCYPPADSQHEVNYQPSQRKRDRAQNSQSKSKRLGIVKRQHAPEQ